MNYTGIMSAGFKDFFLKPELQRAVVDCGFEHPSEGKIIKSNISSTTGSNPLSNDRRRYSLPSKVWYGENCCLCADHSSLTIRLAQAFICPHSLSYERISISNKERI